jgi:hypothetical protein
MHCAALTGMLRSERPSDCLFIPTFPAHDQA